MFTIGEEIFSKDDAGNAASRIGTIFLRTPGLVTKRGVHAMQRLAWIEHLNAERKAAGLAPLGEFEEMAEMESSVDLIFTDTEVLIRPDPERMDLAFKADDELQKLVSKRSIRFLNTHSVKVRNALRNRGENWRMARKPISQDDMARLIENSRVALSGDPIYFYNSVTGTRYVTAEGSSQLLNLEIPRLRLQLKEAQSMMARRNRMGHVELDIFPVSTPPDVKRRFLKLDIDALSDQELVESIRSLDADWRMSLPMELRDESVSNFHWRNEMCRTLTERPNSTLADEDELIQGISPEFYRQIEWLPGARIEGGETIFDPVWEEFDRTRDPELADLCDVRARSILFNIMRSFGEFEYVNIGRIAYSLALHPIEGSRRGDVYMLQCKEKGEENESLEIIRFQKWGIAEHLDEGKDLLRAVFEANEYTDYILDRRLMCRQLGMRLPPHLRLGSFTEPYSGPTQYKGTTIRTAYFARAYVHGTASEKIHPSKFRNPVFAAKFASLMGEAAAIDMIVGRLSTETGENLFDSNYEVIRLDSDGMPSTLTVTDHGGSFVNYLDAYESLVAPYAKVVSRRVKSVQDAASFAKCYVEAFEKSLSSVRDNYRRHRRAFDCLFVNRPFDVSGSGAYRWAKVLERLDKCNPSSVAARLAAAIEESKEADA